MALRLPKTLDFWRGDLPHWQVEDGRYFVTIHLKGAIPKTGQLRIRQIASQFDTTYIRSGSKDRNLRLFRKIFAEMEVWLDRMSPVLHFENHRLAKMVVEAIEHRQSVGVWNMFEFTIMPSHIHLFFDFDDSMSLKKELVDFKRWTATQAARIDPAITGEKLWQSEWFDHWSRSDEQDEQILWYIRRNAVVAGLVKNWNDWTYRGSLADFLET